MASHRETEIKLAVRDPRGLRRRLRELGFRVVAPRQFESNVLFDLPDRRLLKAGKVLRVRRARRDGLLTLKGRGREGRHKVRDESETRVEHPETVERILKTAGFVEAFGYERFRTVYRRRASDSGSAMYDETPVGNYLELEGPAAWIDRVAHELGFGRKDYITETYAALYLERCARLRRKPGRMTFLGRRRKI